MDHDTRQPRPLSLVVGAFALAIAACATSDGAGGASAAATTDADNYAKYIWIDVPGNERVVLHWQARQMPLRVHLPPPSPEIASDPEAVHDVVRDGILEWTDTAGPNIPSFTFVDDPGEADIPIVWEREPSGDWYGAFCALDIDPRTRRFGVSHVLVTTRARSGSELSLDWT